MANHLAARVGAEAVVGAASVATVAEPVASIAAAGGGVAAAVGLGGNIAVGFLEMVSFFFTSCALMRGTLPLKRLISFLKGEVSDCSTEATSSAAGAAMARLAKTSIARTDFILIEWGSEWTLSLLL